MFDLSWTELLVVAGIAIIVVGPKDLPGALRAIGKWVGKAKRMARDFQNQFKEALRETEIDSIKKEIDSVGKIDPLADMRNDVGKLEKGLKSEFEVKPPETKASETKPPEKPAKDSEKVESLSDVAEPEATPAAPVEVAQATPEADTKP
jgi:sec-independent protein translocase protein TatB